MSFLDLHQRDIFLWPSFWDVLDQDQDINQNMMLLLLPGIETELDNIVLGKD
jgi:hypothetical protein